MLSEIVQQEQKEQECRKERKVHFAEGAECHSNDNKSINSNFNNEQVELEKKVYDAKHNEESTSEYGQDTNTHKTNMEVSSCANGNNNSNNSNSTEIYSYHSTVNAIEDENDELAKLLEEAAREREMFDRERQQETACLQSKRKKECSSQVHENKENGTINKTNDSNSDRMNKKKKPKANVKANNRSNFTHFRNKDFTPKVNTNDKSISKKTDNKDSCKADKTAKKAGKSNGYDSDDNNVIL